MHSRNPIRPIRCGLRGSDTPGADSRKVAADVREAEFWRELHFKAALSESSELAQAVALDWAGAAVARAVAVGSVVARESATAELEVVVAVAAGQPRW